MNWSLCSFFINYLPLYLKYTSSIYFDWSFDGWNGRSGRKCFLYIMNYSFFNTHCTLQLCTKSSYIWMCILSASLVIFLKDTINCLCVCMYVCVCVCVHYCFVNHYSSIYKTSKLKIHQQWNQVIKLNNPVITIIKVTSFCLYITCSFL